MVLCIIVVLIVLLVLVVLFGNIGVVVECFFLLFIFGFDIGGIKLELVCIVLVVLVLLVGLVVI